MNARLPIFLLATLITAACAASPIRIDNHPGIVTSVGPIVEDADGQWTMHLTVYDYDGDPVDVHAEYKVGEQWAPIPSCKGDATPCMVGHLRGLNSRTDLKDQPHQIAIQPGTADLQTFEIRLFALEDQSDQVHWSH